jgi:hypothetical protein
MPESVWVSPVATVIEAAAIASARSAMATTVVGIVRVQR